MAKKQSDWRLVMVVRDGRIYTGRYKINDELMTVKYADATKSVNCTDKDIMGRQAEKLLREIVKTQLAAR